MLNFHELVRIVAIHKFMPHTEPGWELYRSFLAVMRTGSLSAAARLLSTTQPTIGRHIEQLERVLGVTLFARSPSGLRPSPVAHRLVSHAEVMEASAAALMRTASGEMEDDAGTVRMTASQVIGGEILPEILTEFHQNHPRIAIELVLNNAPEDLLRGDADIAVRMFRPAQGALIAKRIGSMGIGLYAHRRYVDRYGLPNGLDALEGHTLIGYDRDPVWMRIAAEMKIPLRREQFSFRCDTELAQLSMLRAGYGIAACQVGLALRDPDLIPVLPERISSPLDIWLVMHRDSRSSRRITLLFAHLAETLTRYAHAQPRD